MGPVSKGAKCSRGASRRSRAARACSARWGKLIAHGAGPTGHGPGERSRCKSHVIFICPDLVRSPLKSPQPCAFVNAPPVISYLGWPPRVHPFPQGEHSNIGSHAQEGHVPRAQCVEAFWLHVGERGTRLRNTRHVGVYGLLVEYSGRRWEHPRRQRRPRPLPSGAHAVAHSMASSLPPSAYSPQPPVVVCSRGSACGHAGRRRHRQRAERSRP